MKRKTKRDDLFYVLAFVPTGEDNQFFILTQAQVKDHIEAELKRLDRLEDYPVTGFNFNVAVPHQNKWGVLPE